MTAALLLSYLSAFSVCFGWMLATGFLATLHAALLVSQEAGLERLAEKYPSAKESIEQNRPRWNVLRIAVFLCAALTLIAAVLAGFRHLERGAPGYAWAFPAVLVASAAGLVLFLAILPRVLSEGYADLLSMRCMPIAVLLSRLLFPLARPLARLEQKLLTWTLSEADGDNRPSHEDEILYLVEHASTEELEDEERELIKSVFDFGDTVARESMTPRVDMDGLDAGLTVAAACDRITTSSHSRFPVYHETLDQIRGLVHVKDMLRLISEGRGNIEVGEVAKRVIFIPPDMLISELLQLLRSEKSQLAVVVDEYGGTAGVITVEDILEELVGDIHDEYDDDGHLVQRAPDGSMILDVRIPLDRANELLQSQIPESEDYDSLGGFIYDHLGRIPRPGESLRIDGIHITIRTADARRVETVKITRIRDQEEA